MWSLDRHRYGVSLGRDAIGIRRSMTSRFTDAAIGYCALAAGRTMISFTSTSAG